MPRRGKLIVLEGIDGSGKRTQMDILVRALKAKGWPCLRLSFPHYEGFFGAMVRDYLNGRFGQMAQVDPHFSALLYAGDRLESKAKIEKALTTGKMLLADRYATSNLAHQTARIPPQQRRRFMAWLRKLEYQVYGLPPEDLVIYLRAPAVEAQQRAQRRAAHDPTRLRGDIQESSLDHLSEARRIYDELARQPNWVTVECVQPGSDSMRPKGEINEEVMAAVQSRVLGRSHL
jgi:dTMP kinase